MNTRVKFLDAPQATDDQIVRAIEIARWIAASRDDLERGMNVARMCNHMFDSNLGLSTKWDLAGSRLTFTSRYSPFETVSFDLSNPRGDA